MVVVPHPASEDSLAKEMPSGMRVSDEQVGYVAFCAKLVAVCTLNRGIRNGMNNNGKANLRFINTVCCR